MKKRCLLKNDPSYKNYGGRGITVCERWLEFAAFHADMGDPGDGLSLDRIDVNGDYTPENCRWATSTQQVINRRKWAGTTSSYRGVRFVKKYSSWRAKITVRKKDIELGSFKTERSAALAYNVAAALYGYPLNVVSS